MDNLTKLMAKLSVNDTSNKSINDIEVNALQNLLSNISLRENDENVSGLIDQMQSLKIKNEEDNNSVVEMEITMKDNTIIKIFVPCHIQYHIPLETINIINCF